jgi:hypothetical protein
MPKIRWKDLPPALRAHLFERAPAGAWYKDFGSFKICGEGEYPKTFLLHGQPARGQKL